MKRMFACPKLAVKWIVGFFIRMSFFAICIVLTAKFAPTVYTIVAIIGAVIAFLLSEYLSVKRCGYGASLYKCFIVSKIGKNSVSNCFCKINIDNIRVIGYEHVCAQHANSRRYIKGDFGIVVLISENEAEKGKSFSKYSVKDTICLPLSESVKQLLKLDMKD